MDWYSKRISGWLYVLTISLLGILVLELFFARDLDPSLSWLKPLVMVVSIAVTILLQRLTGAQQRRSTIGR